MKGEGRPEAKEGRSGRSSGAAGEPGGSVSEETLMLCVQAGEISALQDLVARYEKGLYSFLARYTGDKHLAEDLFQETFLRVLEKRQAFDPNRGFRAWLFSIAANLARDACRRREVRARNLDAGGVPKTEPVQPDVEAERHEETELVRFTLEELPEDAKAMVLLHFYQGLRYREIAEILDTPVGTVKGRIDWAVTKLARAWSENAVGVFAGAARKGPKGP